jgi:hypothetical protein
VAAGRTLAARLVARAGRAVAGGGDGLTDLFPSPSALAAANLDGLGLPGARIRALQALAAAVVAGTLDLGASAEEVAARLEGLPGFGAWTAQYVALRALGEPDAFPAGDLVLRRLAAPDTAPLSTRALEERAEAWRPWRGYAVLHLWRAAGDVAPPRPRTRRRRLRSGAEGTTMAQAQDDPVRGKTMRWTFTDGPTAGSTYEHTFAKSGTVKFKPVGGGADTAKPAAKGAAKKKAAKPARPSKPETPKYAAIRAADDAYAVSYLSGSGYTLTVVLNFKDNTLVGFASNDKQWFPVKGTFETVD